MELPAGGTAEVEIACKCVHCLGRFLCSPSSCEHFEVSARGGKKLEGILTSVRRAVSLGLRTAHARPTRLLRFPPVQTTTARIMRATQQDRLTTVFFRDARSPSRTRTISTKSAGTISSFSRRSEAVCANG